MRGDTCALTSQIRRRARSKSAPRRARRGARDHKGTQRTGATGRDIRRWVCRGGRRARPDAFVLLTRGSMSSQRVYNSRDARMRVAVASTCAAAKLRGKAKLGRQIRRLGECSADFTESHSASVVMPSASSVAVELRRERAKGVRDQDVIWCRQRGCGNAMCVDRDGCGRYAQELRHLLVSVKFTRNRAGSSGWLMPLPAGDEKAYAASNRSRSFRMRPFPGERRNGSDTRHPLQNRRRRRGRHSGPVGPAESQPRRSEHDGIRSVLLWPVSGCGVDIECRYPDHIRPG